LAEKSEVRIATGARDFYLLQNVQTGLQPTKWVSGFLPGL